MQLREVTVANFRPFEAATVRLPEHGLVLVAGANNAGKSALLSALDVVAGMGSDTPALRQAGSADPATVVATFDLADNERSAIFATSTRRAEFIATTAGNRLQFVFQDQQPGTDPVLARVLGEWPGRGLQPFVTTGVDEDHHHRVQTIRGLLGGEDNLDPLQLMSQGSSYGSPILLATGIDSVPELRPLQDLLTAWRQRFYHFRALRQGGQRSTNLVVADKLNPTGENLTAVLLGMLTNRFDRLAELRRLVAEIVPLIGQLEVRTSGNSMQAVFAANDIELNLKDLGTGVEQLLMTLVVGLTEAAPFTLVIEEPETNLHPAAQRALLGLLKDWGADRQIIAATHSPVLLDWSPGGDRLWHVIREPEGSRVVPVSDDPADLLAALGVRLSDVLSATRVLVLEGPSDEDVLGAWFPEVLRSPDVAVLHGGGGDNAQYADRFADWLTGVDKIGLRHVLYLRDRDELSPSALKRLEASKTIGVLKHRELENYLLNPAAVAEILRMVLEGQAAPAEQDVVAAMNEAAEGLRRTIVVNRVCRQVQPERPLMEHSLRQQLASQGADQDAVAASVLERLMTQGELREQLSAAWEAAEADVASHSGPELLGIAPGEEILKAVFMRFAGRGYNKRDDGVAIAKAMSAPPEEIRDLLDIFMLDESNTPGRGESPASPGI
jgi:predicted ATPase